MVRYNIKVNYGNEDITKKFYFVHNQYETLPIEEQNKAFHDAVTELNRVYQQYGRFATQRGIVKLFESFGFTETLI